MKIGVIYCCYGNPEYINDCIAPWTEAKKSNDILIAAVHGQFKEYHDLGVEDNDLDSQKILLDKLVSKDLNFVYIQNEYNNEKTYQTEAEIRDRGLQWLLKQNCDIIWLLDNDERYTVNQIDNIIEYIQYPESLPYVWYSINFKNYVLDGKQWIDGFCPPRIFRVNINHGILSHLHYDNDCMYRISCLAHDRLIDYKKLPSKEIPKNWAHIKHLTWLHSNGKSKVAYQLAHFGHCSYKWNEEKQELEIDNDFYKNNNIPIPIINED